MLKLKVGKNFLLIDYRNSEIKLIDRAIPYMMGCFEGTNLLAVALSPGQFNPQEVAKAMESLRTNNVYFLEYLDILGIKKNGGSNHLKMCIVENKESLIWMIRELKHIKPEANVKVININAYMSTPVYKTAESLYKELVQDKNSILSVLNKLDTYKYMSQRFKAIPNEIKIIDNDLKRLDKKVSVCDRVDTLESLKYLKLIDKASASGSTLRLQLHPLPIYPSEELGKVFAPEYFRNNPILFRAASYIYQGCHFGMPGTIIEVDGGFRLRFLETVDHTFDNVFRNHNWSRIGYPHFGDGGFCPGEFNDTMAHAREYGLGYYFVSLKQYLTTANMRDIAGIKVFWYPIYNDEGELVYCGGMDAAIEGYIKGNLPALYERLQGMTWAQKAIELQDFDFSKSGVRQYGAGSLSYGYNGSEDSFLKVCAEKDEELYNKIMEGRK